MRESIKSKVDENKHNKKKRLLDSAYDLFTKKGFKSTTISDISKNAKVAKGTFYLYFDDKYDIQDYLIEEKACELFIKAIESVGNNNVKNGSDRFIEVVDYLIDELVKDERLLVFISKNLSWGLFGNKVSSMIDKNSSGVLDLLKKELEDNDYKMKNPELTIFMVIELTSSVAFSSISTGKPLPINEIKPYLYETIRKMINN